MRELIFRVEYCDAGECRYPDHGTCFVITPDSVVACTVCKYQEIPDENWVVMAVAGNLIGWRNTMRPLLALIWMRFWRHLRYLQM